MLKVVYDADESNVDWYFDTNIFEVPDTVVGLLVSGDQIDDVDNATDNILSVEYAGAITPGSPWQVVPPTMNIDFVGGGKLGPQSGVVVSS